jgi:phosphoenolpyruvate carboxykinase (ATP)
VPKEVLVPENTWKNKDDYRAKATGPAERFHKNFELFAPDTPEAVRNAGPKVAVSR